MNYEGPVGESIVWYEGPAVLNGSDVERLRLWFPLASSDLRMRWTASGGVTDLGQADIDFEHPQLGNCRADGFVLDTTGFGFVDSRVIGNSTIVADRVISGWANLPMLGGSHERFDDYSTVIEAAGWKIGFSAIQSFTDRERHARREGTPVYVSHRSVLTRVDGRQFSADDALTVLQAFQVGLSFALGRFVAPLGPIGWCDGDPAWILTPAWSCDDGLGTEGIIFPLVSEDFVDATARLVAELLTSADEASVRYLVMHAIVAHTAGRVEQRLMTAQAGLEFYAWFWLVAGQQLTATEARRLSAGDRIDLALTNAQIPNGIPDDLAALIDQATDPGDQDVPTTGPGLGTWVRNRIGHPKDPHRPYAIEGLVFQASLLMREYLELLVLHRIGYGGSWRRMYPEGRWSGEREPVPWI